MAVENDFLPFAVGGSANVLTQAQYAALTSLLQNGFQSGIANSQQLNKVWRQSSIMAAVLAQFIVNTTGQTAIDDGTTATLLANLTAAVSANSEALIGSARNLTMSVTAASASATLTADEIIVGSALGGLKYTLPSFNKTINLATTGAGGMDTGTAPVSGFVALYAIYNPTTGASALLATNATSAAAPSVYGGANMPSGYTASGLVAVVPTNASSQFAPVRVNNRTAWTGGTIAATTTQIASLTAVSMAGVVPPNAKFLNLVGTLNTTSAQNAQITVADNSSGTLAYQFAASTGGGNIKASSSPFPTAAISSNTIYWNTSISSGTFNSANFLIQSYEI